VSFGGEVFVIMTESQMNRAYSKIVRKKGLLTRRATNRAANDTAFKSAQIKRAIAKAPAGSLGAALR